MGRHLSTQRALSQGAVWGIGHTVALFIVGGTVLLQGTAMPGNLAQGMELAVDGLLI